MRFDRFGRTRRRSRLWDAATIADQAPMRRDLQPLRVGDETAVELRTLISRHADLGGERTRVLNRLRAQLLYYFLALERVRPASMQSRIDIAHQISEPGQDPRRGTAWIRSVAA
ncbi:IS110 family transposase [Nocardia sp. CA-084685]|uniref:IS110 family transposase n=1 Tax=Nocardia sp. CA-084685 TaxID=3239970 RepID=UPI003D95FADD